MEEIMEAVGTEGTTPTAAAEGTETVEETVETTVETAETETGEGTTPTGEEDTGTAQEAEETAGAGEPFTIPVQFNHESRDLTVEEAQLYAQKGMKFDELTPTLDKLRMLASETGKSVPEMVEALVTARENALKERLLQEAGGNESVAERLMELEMQKRKAAFETVKANEATAEKNARQETVERLAAEFAELKAEHPEYGEFKDVPKAVVNDAIRNKIPLKYAHAHYFAQQHKKIEQNKASQARAAAASVGSQASVPAAGETDPAIAALMRGLGSVL